MGKRKRGSNARRTAYEDDGFVEDLLPRDENGYVETGYSISFSDLMADIDDDDGDDADGVAAEEDEAPRGGPGSQVLPVAKHLPEDFDGNPTDGDEYLFLVRREAATHPGIIFAPQFSTSRHLPEETSTADARSTTEHPHRPDDAWRDAYVEQFRIMRAVFASRDHRATTKTAQPLDVPETYLPIPDAANESAWKSYIHGRKRKLSDLQREPQNGADESEVMGQVPEDGSDEARHPPAHLSTSNGSIGRPRPPIPALLRALDHHTALSLLGHYETWLADRLYDYQHPIVPSTVFLPPAMRRKQAAQRTSAMHPSGTGASAVAKATVSAPSSESMLLPPLDAQWLLSLLAVIDPLLSSNEISSLRSLARTCQDIAQAIYTDEKDRPSNPAISLRESSQNTIEACWRVVAAVWEGWGQRDLW